MLQISPAALRVVKLRSCSWTGHIALPPGVPLEALNLLSHFRSNLPHFIQFRVIHTFKNSKNKRGGVWISRLTEFLNFQERFPGLCSHLNISNWVMQVIDLFCVLNQDNGVILLRDSGIVVRSMRHFNIPEITDRKYIAGSNCLPT